MKQVTCGFEPTTMPDHLFDYQRALVDWAVRHGRAALFPAAALIGDAS